MKLKNLIIASFILFSLPGLAADYVIDTKGAHASINFRVMHLGYSWVTGRFNTFKGTFSYDAKQPNASGLEVSIDTKSVDSNHAERDKHLRGEDFMEADKYPEAKFVATEFMLDENSNGKVKGNFSLHGVTKQLTLKVKKIGEGKDPWGGYRVGFAATGKFALADFAIKKNLGPKSKEVELDLHIEGKRL